MEARLKVLQAQGKARERITSLLEQAIKLESEDKYDEALPLAEQMLAIAEGEIGPDDEAVATALIQLGGIYTRRRDFARAEPAYLRALAIYEKKRGPEHLFLDLPLGALGSMYKDQGDYDRAEQMLRRAFNVTEKEHGPDSAKIVIRMDSLALLYMKKADYKRAEELLLRSLAIREKASGRDHRELIAPLHNLALLNNEKGDYARAEKYRQRTLQISTQANGAEHILTALYSFNLGQIVSQQGDIVRAKELMERALPIVEKSYGAEHPTYGVILSDLSELYRDLGDYPRAEASLLRVVEIDEKAYGAEHPELATTLNNLATFYHYRDEQAKAEPLARRALAIREKALGPEHPDVASSLNTLGLIYDEQGDKERAARMFERALQIFEKKLGPRHPRFATAVNNLGGVYHGQGAYERARPLYERALSITQRARGEQHPDVAALYANLAMLAEAAGDPTQAIRHLTRANDIREETLSLILTIGSEQQKLLYLETLTNETHVSVSFHLASAPADGTAARLALTTILRRKGRALDAMSDQIGALRRRLNAEDRALLDQLAAARSELATLKLSSAPSAVDDAAGAAQGQELIRRREVEVGRLEELISARSKEFRAQSQPVTIERVQASIPAEAALVELVLFRPVDAKAIKFKPARYAAYVLRREGGASSAQWVDLGEAAPIDEAVARWRGALSNPRRADARQLARELDARVMLPVRRLLGERARALFISPDGALNLIPFSALVDERGRYLIESYTITYLSSGRDLLRLQTEVNSRESPTLFANPSFDAGGISARSGGGDVEQLTEADNEGGLNNRRSAALAEAKFSPLPGTAAEAAAINLILTEPSVFTGAQATETALKRVAGPSILHVATHGFFLPDQSAAAGAQEARGLKLGGGNEKAGGENPLLRSGLALAGVNNRGSGANDDGLLTALEATSLDLWGTKLVVLSACETGVGEVKNGDGVYGLRRALVLAGSESQLMSLWQVSDAATRDLMVAYYKRLQAGEGRSEALRQVQLGMLKNTAGNRNSQKRNAGEQRGVGDIMRAPAAMAGDYSHPFYWASFIQSGEWRKLGKGVAKKQ